MSQEKQIQFTASDNSDNSTSAGKPCKIREYLKTVPALLRLAQLILGCICIGITAYYLRTDDPLYMSYYVVSVTFLICTAVLLLASLFDCSNVGNEMSSKTGFEAIYYSFAAIMILISSFALLAYRIDDQLKYGGMRWKFAPIVASLLGITNGTLYSISAYFEDVSGSLKTSFGLLKLPQLLIGIVSAAISRVCYVNNYNLARSAFTFDLLILLFVPAFIILTFFLLAANIIASNTNRKITKLYGMTCNSIAACLLLIASIFLLAKLQYSWNRLDDLLDHDYFYVYLVLTVLSLINVALYSANAILDTIKFKELKTEIELNNKL